METPQQISLADEGEETLVTPRFDEEETIVAQPVVPLETVVRRAWPRPRMLALLLLSTLVGGVLGGAGLYFYQSRASAATVVTSPERLNAPAQVAQPSPAPTTAVSNQLPQPTPTAVANESAKDDAKATAKKDAPDTNAQAREPHAPQKETEREHAWGKASDDEAERDDAPRRGKKGDSDAGDSAVQLEQRPRRAAYDTQDPIPEDSSPASLRARRVEEGLRRAERIRERQRRRREKASRSPRGSIEGIFEGQP